MSTEVSANNSTTEEPLTPGVAARLSSPRSSSFSTPGNPLVNQSAAAQSAAPVGSKFNLFEHDTTPMQRSTNLLQHQNTATAPPFLRDPNQMQPNMPTDLVDINLALGALDLDFGAAARPQQRKVSGEIAVGDISTSSNEDQEQTIQEGDENIHHPMQLHQPQHQQQQHQMHGFGPGVVPQPMHPFFPMNEFGQPLHAPFSHMDGLNGSQSHMNHPWPTKPGQAPFGGALPTNGSPGLESMNHTPPIPHPGMMAMAPFDFGPDGMSPPINGPPGIPHDSSNFGNGMSFGNGFKNGPKDRRNNYQGSNGPSPVSSNGPNGMENGVSGNGAGHFNGQQAQHPLQNSQLWPPLNGGPQSFENRGFGNVNGFISNGMGPNNGGNDRRFPFYQNGSNHHHHHNHHNNHHHNGRRMMGPRGRRGEDASKFANAKLDDFIGQIYSLCKDQHGCRFLQKQLDLDPQNATPIFDEISMHIVELMIDPFGNYLVQKLLEKVNDEQRISLVKIASPEFVSIALDPHGTRALQKLVECINSEEEAKIIVKSLSNDVVSLSRDLNGNHVIQKCLQRLTSEDSQFIFDTASENCLEIATHRHGCCVLQRCLDHGSPEQINELSLVISKHTVELSLDAFGNYVVQYVIAQNVDEAVTQIVESIKSDLINLALQKFGSNVIEKCLRVAQLSHLLIDELLSHEDEMVKLLNDPFGNYVLQTSLDVAKNDQFEKLSNLLKPLLPQVRNTPHGRRILARLQHSGFNHKNNHNNFRSNVSNNNDTVSNSTLVDTPDGSSI